MTERERSCRLPLKFRSQLMGAEVSRFELPAGCSLKQISLLVPVWKLWNCYARFCQLRGFCSPGLWTWSASQGPIARLFPSSTLCVGPKTQTHTRCSIKNFPLTSHSPPGVLQQVCALLCWGPQSWMLASGGASRELSREGQSLPRGFQKLLIAFLEVFNWSYFPLKSNASSLLSFST